MGPDRSRGLKEWRAGTGIAPAGNAEIEACKIDFGTSELAIFDVPAHRFVSETGWRFAVVLGNLRPDGKFSCKMSFRADKLTRQIIMLTGCMDPIQAITEIRNPKSKATRSTGLLGQSD